MGDVEGSGRAVVAQALTDRPSRRPRPLTPLAPAPEVTRRPGRRAAFVIVLAAVLLAAWVALLWGVSTHVFPGTSDDANALLAGHSMAHGNVLLHGWQLPADPMWAVDLPFYAAFTAVTGVRTSALHAAPLALAVVAVGAVVWLATIRTRTRWLAAGVAFVLAGLPVWPFATWLLQSPMHVSTTILCMVAFVLLGRRKERWRWMAGVAVLGVALFADPFAYVLGVGPLLAAGAVRALQRRRLSVGADPWTAAVAAVAAGLVLRVAVPVLGGFTLAKSVAFADPGTWPSGLRVGGSYLLKQLGAHPDTPHVSQNPLLHYVHLVGGVAVAVALAVAAMGIWRRVTKVRGAGVADEDQELGSWLDDILFFGVLASVGGFALLSKGEPDASRYVMPGVLFAAALAGRVLGRWDLGARPSLRRGAAAGLMIVAALYALTPVTIRQEPVQTSDAPRLVRWLDAHGLHDGLAPYWFSSYLTVVSGDRVRVRPVIEHRGRLAGFSYFADSEWFRAKAGDDTRFVLFASGRPDGVDLAAATATFGPPARLVGVSGFNVGIWSHPLLERLEKPVGDRIAMAAPPAAV